MKKKKNIILIISLIIVISLITILSILFMNYKNSNSLTLEENKWIDKNKYNIIDIAPLSDIPILNYDGKGILYDYLEYVTDKYSLKFNIVPYKLDNVSNYEYNISILSSVSKDDIVLLEDNYVLVTKENMKLSNLSDIKNLKLGILKNDKEEFSQILLNNNIEFSEYDTYTLLKESILNEDIDGIIILKSIAMEDTIKQNYNFSFQFNDKKSYYVLNIKGDNTLNNIFKKTYKNWEEKYYLNSYNNNLIDAYFKFKNVSDGEQKKLRSKSYVYGFINYGVYNYLKGSKISGLSGVILTDFNKFSGISIKYTRYNSLNKLLKDFNSKQIDFMINLFDQEKLVDVYNTTPVFDNKLVIITDVNNRSVINSVEALKGKEVLTIKDSYLESKLSKVGAKIKSYNNMDDLVSDFSNNCIALVNLENYNYYKSSAFKDSRINYLIYDNNYSYVINKTSDNELFMNLFNFYLSYESIDKIISNNYKNIAYENSNITYILVILLIILTIYVVVDFYNHVKVMLKKIRKNKRIHLSKEDKIKYIDQLTSLKNRAYFNSKIEMWDDSEVYPQAIIVIDLNNISYINDNYGREEGDKVITEAANILIQSQVENSEIIRTDGNEFVIYMVGYNEKQVVSYLRKLNREFKNLSHGFGSASGYSIINDAIKTIDDALNEATIDMKNNKEDIDY